MTFRPAVAFALVLAAIPAPVAFSGCGAEDAAGVDVAKAASATAAKRTANITMHMSISGVGLPQPVRVDAQGVTDLRRPRMDITFDFGELLALAGQSGDGAVELLIDGGQLYLKPPSVQGLTIPEGKAWVGVRLAEVAQALGLDPQAIGKIFNADPSAQLRALRAAGHLKQLGSETLRGAKVSHVRGTYPPKQAIALLPADDRRAAEAALRRLSRLGGADPTNQPQTIDMWIDGSSVVRKLSSTAAIPAQRGLRPGKLALTYELTNFGAPLDVSRPDSVWDATDKLVGRLKAVAAGAA